jgi:hypothetical protein
MVMKATTSMSGSTCWLWPKKSQLVRRMSAAHRPARGVKSRSPSRKVGEDDHDRGQGNGRLRGRFGHKPLHPSETRDQPGEERRFLPGALAPHLEVEPRAPLEHVPRHEGVPSLVIAVDAPRRDDPLSDRGQDEQGREQRDKQAAFTRLN